MKQLFSFSTWGYKQWLIVVLCFLLSVVIRWPNLDRPLSKHHEFVTSISLRVLQAWEDDGIANLHYSPAMNFGGIENKFIDNHATSLGEMHDSKGNYYYISHPPFAYILPYACFQAIGAKATTLNLQLFHLLVNFLCVVIVVLITRTIATDPKVALFAGIIYVLLPATLWFQANTYMSDMLVHLFFMIGVLLFLKLKESKDHSLPLWALFLVNLFLMIYTSWLGVFFGFIVFCWAVFKIKGVRRIGFIVTCLLGISSALLLTYYQYSSINGYEAYINQLSERLSIRGGNSSANTNGYFFTKLKEIAIVLFNYAVHYWHIIGLILVMIIIERRKKNISNTLLKYRAFLIISTAPILALHISLLNYSTHDFTVLYASVFFSIIGATVLIRISEKKSRLLLISLSIFSSLSYYTVNLPGEFSIKGDYYGRSMILGNQIGANLESREVGFMLDKELDPMVILYAKRNIKTVASYSEAKHWMEGHHVTIGRLFYYEGRVLLSKTVH